MDLKLKLPNLELPTHDAAKAAGEAGRTVGDTVGEAGRIVGERLDAARGGLGSMGGRLQVADRIDAFRNPHRSQGPTAATGGLALLGGLSTGMALMYFLDPEKGADRRRVLVQRISSFGSMVSERAGSTAQDLRDRGNGSRDFAADSYGDYGATNGASITSDLAASTELSTGIGSGTFDDAGYTASTGGEGAMGDLGAADLPPAATTDAWAEAESYATDQREESR